MWNLTFVVEIQISGVITTNTPPFKRFLGFWRGGIRRIVEICFWRGGYPQKISLKTLFFSTSIYLFFFFFLGSAPSQKKIILRFYEIAWIIKIYIENTSRYCRKSGKNTKITIFLEKIADTWRKIFLFYKDPNDSLTQSLTHSLSHSLDKKCLQIRPKFFYESNLSILLRF